MLLKSLLSDVNSWADFKNKVLAISKKEKGNAFEELTKYYLLINPVYRNQLKNVWLQKEIPVAVIKKLNLPSNDQGIDLIAEHTDGSYWAIQCKFLQDENQRLSHRAISTFTSLSKLTAKQISYCLVATTADDYAKLYKGNNQIGFINADEWNKLDIEFFSSVRKILAGKEIAYKPYKPKKHQKKAISEAHEYFISQKNKRGKLVFPCGAGKSLTGYWLMQELKSQSTIVAVPSLSLVKQTLEVYLRESVANKEKIEWLCVCSDEGIGKNDDVVIHTNEIGVPCITDKQYIANWLKTNKNKKTVIFTTYQSGKTIADACKIAKVKFDLGIMDEAHKTVGNQDKLFSHLLFDKNIKIDKRTFMTATERRYAGSSDNILSMDDESVYGQAFTQMPFKEAINEGILSDYKIITLFISDKEVKDIIEKNAFVKPKGKEWDKETEARTLASMIALRKAMKQFPIHHAVTFHSSIKKAEAFEQSQGIFTKAFPQFKKVDSFHVSGSMATSQRSKIVNDFAASKKAIITNAKCLTEGVDVPNIDCVLFADSRKSKVDIVQAVGRALRKKEGKQYGYVILPVFTKSKTKEEIIESAEFKEILSTLRALASNDERIIEFFRDKNKKGKTSGSSKNELVQFDIDLNLIEQINEKDLLQSLQLKTWDKLAKLSWMPFEEAREYVRKLNLKSRAGWQEYCKTKNKPFDIPFNPEQVYKLHGWLSVGDWLGTNFIATNLREYRKFEDARSFVNELGLKSTKEWRSYSKSINKPIDIPSVPEKTYRGKGWISMGDWLGTNYVSVNLRNYLSFTKARKYVRELKLKSQKEWMNYCKSGDLPHNIPSKPARVFKGMGWISMGDWLGTFKVASHLIKHRTFHDAKTFAQSLNLQSSKDWKKYCNENVLPFGIPKTPEQVYKKGWISFGDFLGTGFVQTQSRKYLSYDEAKDWVRKQNFKSAKEWFEFCKSGKKPDNIPAKPTETYRDNGWLGYGDFLGTGRPSDWNREFMSFEEARNFVRKLNFKTYAEFVKYASSGKRPLNLPSNPQKVYKEWNGSMDFIGSNRISNFNKNFLTFTEAQKYVHQLKIKSLKDWQVFARTNQRPNNIPSDPARIYKNKGWKGWAEFLGKKGK
jgi:superfamily II DNA or RNA helicase